MSIRKKFRLPFRISALRGNVGHDSVGLRLIWFLLPLLVVLIHSIDVFGLRGPPLLREARPIVLISDACWVAQTWHHLLIRIIQSGQLRAGSFFASDFKTIGEHLNLLVIGHHGVRPLIVPSLHRTWIVQGVLCGKGCQLQVVLQFVSLLSLAHSKFDRLLIASALLDRDKKVVKRISYLFLLSLVLSYRHPVTRLSLPRR